LPCFDGSVGAAVSSAWSGPLRAGCWGRSRSSIRVAARFSIVRRRAAGNSLMMSFTFRGIDLLSLEYTSRRAHHKKDIGWVIVSSVLLQPDLSVSRGSTRVARRAGR
jgi:hypothetical protein